MIFPIKYGRYTAGLLIKLADFITKPLHSSEEILSVKKLYHFKKIIAESSSDIDIQSRKTFCSLWISEKASCNLDAFTHSHTESDLTTVFTS